MPRVRQVYVRASEGKLKEKAMADVEEDADFGSHFLDSMLEVEMTEEDNELDVSKNDDPLDTLPPIPTFDLQSETISYKDVYRNAIPQPVIASLPLAASNASNIPLVLKPSSMLIYSGEVPPPKPTPIIASVQRIPSKPNPTTPAKRVNVSIDVSNKTDVREPPPSKFMEEVFKVEYVKNVFVKADPPWDISLVSNEEMKYYKECFKDVSKVQNCRLHCTICDKHLGCAATIEKKINVHTMLKVLTCKPCFEFYGDGNFPCDKGDNCEIYCRWCGQGGALVCCSFCPSVFCKRCVKRNFGPNFLKSLEKASDWACFCCAQKPLWPHRAICRALLEFLEKKKTDRKTPLRDTTSCCKAAGLTRKKLREALDKSKVPTPQPQSPHLKVSPAPKTPDPKNKTLTPLKPLKPEKGRGRLVLKPIVQLKASDRVKIPLNPNGNARPSAITSIFSPRSIISGNNIIRGITTSGPTKLISAFPSPQLIQSPVIHGETLITPPSRLLVPAKAPPDPSQNSPFVRVSLTHQAPNLDVNKMPTVKIPHEVQGLVLRLIFPDNKMHYVRLAPDGTGCKASKDFPMPQFNEKGASFVEENLAEAFKISKLMYDKLLQIKEKVNSRTKLTEESVFNSSVRKLHLAYEKTMELFRELDKTLQENHEEWKNGAKNSVDVIDISDDEAAATAKKIKPNRYSNIREKCKKLSDDSDIEILDDIVVNGKTPTNSNFKEKYRLRSPLDQGKTQMNSKGPGRKRKRGRLRKSNKRLKTTEMQNGQPEEEDGEGQEDPLRTDPVDEAPGPTKDTPSGKRKSRLGEETSAGDAGSEKTSGKEETDACVVESSSGNGESEEAGSEVNGASKASFAEERASASPSGEAEGSNVA